MNNGFYSFPRPNNQASISISSGSVYAKTTIIDFDADYILHHDDYVLFVDTFTYGEPICIDLIANAPYVNGKIIIIKDYGGAANTYPIKIIGTIDGVVYDCDNFIEKQYYSRQIICYDGNWYKLSFE